MADKGFPGVPVVIDRFHVERMANDALEKLRKAVRKRLPTRQRLKLKDDRHLLLGSFDRLSAERRPSARSMPGATALRPQSCRTSGIWCMRW